VAEAVAVGVRPRPVIRVGRLQLRMSRLKIGMMSQAMDRRV
jgi:hypothetical protein